jgi:hypothetical protein
VGLRPARPARPGHGVTVTRSRSRRAASSSAMSLAWRTMRAGARRRRTLCKPKRQFGHRCTWFESNGHRRTENEARHRPSPDRNPTPTLTNPARIHRDASLLGRQFPDPRPFPHRSSRPTSTNHHDHPGATNARVVERQRQGWLPQR